MCPSKALRHPDECPDTINSCRRRHNKLNLLLDVFHARSSNIGSFGEFRRREAVHLLRQAEVLMEGRLLKVPLAYRRAVLLPGHNAQTLGQAEEPT